MQDNYELMYEEIKLEIEHLHSKALAAISAEPNLLSLFKGWKVFYSPLIYKPKVLFIGINPGGGEEGEYDPEHKDKGELEYLHYNYVLASETKEVFEMAGKYEALYNSAKINYYYLATVNEKDIYKITDYLGRHSKDDIGEQLIVNARKWTKSLIEIMEPEVIICEGTKAYSLVTDLFLEGIHMKEDAEYIYVDEIGANIIGYKRISFSRIKDKVKLSKIIASLVN